MVTSIIIIILISAIASADVSNSENKRSSQNKIDTFSDSEAVKFDRDLNKLDNTNNGLEAPKGFALDQLSNAPDFQSLPRLDTLSELSNRNVQEQTESENSFLSTASQDLPLSSLTSKTNGQFPTNLADRSPSPSAFRNQPRVLQMSSNSDLNLNDPFLRSRILNQIDEILSSASRSNPDYGKINVNQIDLQHSLNDNLFDEVNDVYRQYPSNNIEFNDAQPYQSSQMPYNYIRTPINRFMDKYPNRMNQITFPSSTSDRYLDIGRTYYLPERNMHFRRRGADPWFLRRYLGEVPIRPRYTRRVNLPDYYYPYDRSDRTMFTPRELNQLPPRLQTQGPYYGSQMGREHGLLSTDTYWDSK